MKCIIAGSLIANGLTLTALNVTAYLYYRQARKAYFAQQEPDD